VLIVVVVVYYSLISGIKAAVEAIKAKAGDNGVDYLVQSQGSVISFLSFKVDAH
jgi:hypothetical protein